MARFNLAVIIFMGLAAGSVASAASAADTVAVDDGNPPFMYVADGGAAGIYPALLREAYKRMGDEIKIVPMPWKRALSGVDDGEHGIGGVYKNAERLAKYDYSDKLFDETMVVYVPSSNTFTFSGVDSLKGKTVGVIRGWSYGDAFDSAVKAGEIKVQETPTDAQNMAKLAAGRLDAVLAVRQSAQVILADREYASKVVALSPPLFENPSYVAFAKGAGKTATLNALNAALDAMRRDGAYDNITASVLSAR